MYILFSVFPIEDGIIIPLGCMLVYLRVVIFLKTNKEGLDVCQVSWV